MPLSSRMQSRGSDKEHNSEEESLQLQTFSQTVCFRGAGIQTPRQDEPAHCLRERGHFQQPTPAREISISGNHQDQQILIQDDASYSSLAGIDKDMDKTLGRSGKQRLTKYRLVWKERNEARPKAYSRSERVSNPLQHHVRAL